MLIKAKSIQSKEEQKRICGECGVEYDADLMAYAAYDDDELVGVCQFTMREKTGYLYCLAPKTGTYNEDALFVMGRTALNFIDLVGVHYAVYLGDDAALAKRVGFSENASSPRFTMDLTGVFTGEHCK